MRLWQLSDMAGVTGTEYLDSTAVDGLAAVAEGVTPVILWTAKRPGGGTATAARAFRDDFRPYLGTVNGKQSVYFDTATRQLNLDTAGLPSGRGDKFWFIATKNMETRGGDFYPFGYGGGSGTAVTWKMRQGQVPYSDVGSVGFNVGSAPIATTGISIITETYRQVGTLSRSWYNGQAQPSTYTRERNTSASNARLGHWPTYGNGAHQHLLRLGWGYGEPSADDILRLQGWLSWDTGDNGASLPADHPYKSAAPMVSEGDASPIAGTAAPALANVGSTGTAALRIMAAAALTVGAIGSTGEGRAQIAGQASTTLAAIVAEGGGGLRIAGDGAASLGSITCTSNAATPLAGALGAPLGAVTCAAAGTAPILAAAPIALDPIATVSAARADIRGAVAASLGNVTTATDTGRAAQSAGALAATLDQITGTAVSQARIAATAVMPLGTVQSAGQGRSAIAGQALSSIGGLDLIASGIGRISGASSIPLGLVTSAATGKVATYGQAAVRLGGILATAAGTNSDLVLALPSAVNICRAPTPVRTVRPTSPTRIIIAKGNRVMQWSPKRAVNRSIRGVDWARFLGDDEIVSSTAEATDGVKVDQQGVIGKVQTFRLSGGQPGTAFVTCSIWTRNGEEIHDVVPLTVTP